LAIPDFPLSFGHVIPTHWDPKIAVHFAHRAGAMAVALLIAANRPMSPAELRDEIRKEMPTTTREALERAIWLELRKDKPRLARLGEGKYGLPEWRYRWITDGALQAK